MDVGDLLIRWTVRLALGLYAFALAGRLLAKRHPSWMIPARWAWTLGCVAYLAHVVSAFHFRHGWSHEAAYRETAGRTEGLFGSTWGGGLYLNYLFTLVWAADVLWWWLGRASYERRPRWLEWTVQGFLAFMAFNGAVIFATGPVRWAGLGACAALAVLWWLARRGAPMRPCSGSLTRPPGAVQSD
jgi:hypothetical protein